MIGFVGRFTRDKGIPELVQAYEALRRDRPELRLLLVGDFENGDPVPEAVRSQIEHDAGIVRSGFVEDTSPYYHLMDLLVLPTHREGFPICSLEAQAAGKPVVTTTATGAVDSVQNGRTGVLVPVRDVPALVQAIGSLLDDPAKRTKMGREGQNWVKQVFAGGRVRAALVHEYEKVMRERLGPNGRRGPQRGWRKLAKRAVDVIGAGVGLVALSPLLATTALLIRVAMGRPVLFRQTRPGRYGRPFTLLKFRTMTENAGGKNRILEDGERLTKLGRLLRAWSLDELPQLWNVVRGELSLVGPRPLLVQYMERYTPEQARRHEVMPGITGWAQVNGRNTLSWDDKFVLDKWYVDNWNLILDFRILFLTFWRVVQREGISRVGHATMTEFMGSKAQTPPSCGGPPYAANAEAIHIQSHAPDRN